MGYEEQIMSEDNYPSIFSLQMATIVFIILQIFFATRAVLKIGEYLVNKPLQAASMSADNVAAKRNEHLAEKQSFEGKWEVLRTISQPRTLSADIPAA